MPTNHSAAALSIVRRAKGVAVTIVRADSEWETTATPGKTIFEDKRPSEAGRSVQRTETRDFLLPASEYLVDGEAATPAAGDRVNEAARSYEVVSVYGEPPFRFVDLEQTWLRVHTQLVDY
jgi:hypothetical protein